MDLGDFIRQVGGSDHRLAGLGTPTQLLLRNAGRALAEHSPGGLLVIGSGGKGTATFTPWVGFFDPDVTVTPEEGIYVVYLFSADLTAVQLSDPKSRYNGSHEGSWSPCSTSTPP